MMAHRARSGYVFLLGVLFIGIISVTTTISLLLLGGAAEQSGRNIVDSEQALEYALACAERAIQSLRSDLSYAGAETITFAEPDLEGSCTIQAIGGSGPMDRTICAMGERSGATRRVEVSVQTLFPRVLIRHWREVASFSLCP